MEECDLLQCIQGLNPTKYLEAGYNLFIRTQIYFYHPMLTVLTIREQINYSTLTGEGMGEDVLYVYCRTEQHAARGREGKRRVIFPSITKGKYLLFISTCLVWA